VAKVGNQRYSTSTCNVAKVFNDLTGYSGSVGVTDSSKLPQVKSMADLDAVFLANLGIDINHPHNPPPAPIPAFFSNVAFPLGGAWNALWYEEILDFNPLYNIANEPPLPGYSMQQQQAISELILNDFRMSFFGASPDYPNFTPLDFDGDGTVYCSCYPSSGIASEVALGLSQHAPVVLGVPTAPTNYFSNTGCFFIGKSHFWRIRARGEVWDNVTNKTLSEGLLDTVLCVDPADANQADPLPNPAGGQWSTHVIYQRWWYDLYRGLMSRKL